MNETARNRMVGLFMLAGLAIMGWLVMRFGDLPGLVSRYNARIITVWLPETADLQANTRVVFRGYSVGKVLAVSPPQPWPVDDPAGQRDYRVRLDVAVGQDYSIPANVSASVVRGGFGAGYLELVLEEAAAGDLLADGQELIGRVAGGNQLFNESTQIKLDTLLTAMTELSHAMQAQLTPRPPDQVDAAGQVYANMTTAIMRLDETLRHVNAIVGDEENRLHIKEAIVAVRDAADGIRATSGQANDMLEEVRTLVVQSQEAVGQIQGSVGRLTGTWQQTGTQATAMLDELSGALRESRTLLANANAGSGTFGRLATDPRLYESLTDLSERIDLAMAALAELARQWKDEGVRMKLK